MDRRIGHPAVDLYWKRTAADLKGVLKESEKAMLWFFSAASSRMHG
jgi:hypothetical protein